MAANAVSAIYQKKEMLEAMIKLLAQSYFAGPAIPHNLSELREAKQKRSDVGIANKIQRSR
jgi:hypothetical protein